MFYPDKVKPFNSQTKNLRLVPKFFLIPSHFCPKPPSMICLVFISQIHWNQPTPSGKPNICLMKLRTLTHHFTPSLDAVSHFKIAFTGCGVAWELSSENQTSLSCVNWALKITQHLSFPLYSLSLDHKVFEEYFSTKGFLAAQYLICRI